MSSHPVRRHLLRQSLGLAGAALLAGAPPAARAQVRDLGDAINKAGRQRMLSQRLVKAWLALGQHVADELAQRVLDQSLATFDRQLVELKAFAPDPTIRNTYQMLDTRWNDLKTALVGSRPARGQAAALLALDEQVLALAHQGTQQLEAAAGRPAGRLVNLAGRQRMLSQRMAKFYLALQWGLGGVAASAELTLARTEFLAAHDQLVAAPQNTQAIRDELELARGQWLFFEAALRQLGGANPRHATDVLITSENILNAMDRVTGLYARLSA